MSEEKIENINNIDLKDKGKRKLDNDGVELENVKKIKSTEFTKTDFINEHIIVGDRSA